jgi:dihydroxyacetone kinase-like predicted kinase
VLARAGVVDAGGRGLVLLLDALAAVVTGRASEHGPIRLGPRNRSALESVRETGSDEYGYEVQFLLHAPEEVIEPLKKSLLQLGDSLVVVGTGEGLFNVHVHVNDVGAAIEAGIEAGRPHRITVIRFADQIAGEGDRVERTGTAIVAVAPGIGLADLFRSEGVFVVDGGPTQNPSTADVLAGIRETGAARVILLPNASAVGGVAEMAAGVARQEGIAVAVVPTKSPVQGLAAVAVHDENRRYDDDVIAVAEAAAATRFAEVTIAVRESITYAGRCQAGDVLGLIDGEVVEIGSDIAAVGISLVQRLIAAGGELVTVLSGSDDGAAAAAERVHTYIHTEHPLVEISAFVGGQPHFPLLIGVE